LTYASRHAAEIDASLDNLWKRIKFI
jgi:hypothetical protein